MCVRGILAWRRGEVGGRLMISGRNGIWSKNGVSRIQFKVGCAESLFGARVGMRQDG